MDSGISINYAYQTFRWDSEAKSLFAMCRKLELETCLLMAVIIFLLRKKKRSLFRISHYLKNGLDLGLDRMDLLIVAIAKFKSGMIEAWGRGFDKIKDACAKYDGRLPEYTISASGIMSRL